MKQTTKQRAPFLDGAFAKESIADQLARPEEGPHVHVLSEQPGCREPAARRRAEEGAHEERQTITREAPRRRPGHAVLFTRRTDGTLGQDVGESRLLIPAIWQKGAW